MLDEKIEALNEIKMLKNEGESHYFNMFQDGGAVVYFRNGLYELFEVPLYGGKEGYHATYGAEEMEAMVDEAFSWT